MRDNGNNPFTSKGCTGSIRQSESAGTNGGHFSAEKSDFRGMERLWCVQQRRCIPRKMGCPDPRRRGEAGDDPRTATARTGPRVPHGQRAGEPGQHREESLGQTFSGFGHHNHHHHWLLPLSQPKSKPPRTLIINLTMTATMTTSCPSL